MNPKDEQYRVWPKKHAVGHCQHFTMVGNVSYHGSTHVTDQQNTISSCICQDTQKKLGLFLEMHHKSDQSGHIMCELSRSGKYVTFGQKEKKMCINQ